MDRVTGRVTTPGGGDIIIDRLRCLCSDGLERQFGLAEKILIKTIAENHYAEEHNGI